MGQIAAPLENRPETRVQDRHLAPGHVPLTKSERPHMDREDRPTHRQTHRNRTQVPINGRTHAQIDKINAEEQLPQGHLNASLRTVQEAVHR